MRGAAALAAALALAGLLLSPLAGARSEGLVLAAGLAVTMPIDVRQVEDVDPSAPQAFPGVAAGPVGDCASAGRLDIKPAFDSFSFFESDRDTGCAQGLVEVPVPGGARAYRLTFEADRHIRQASTAALPIRMVQKLIVTGGASEEQEVFGDTDGPSQGFQTVVREDDIPSGLESLTFAWFFQDAGQDFGQQLPTSLVQGQEFTATVRRIGIEFLDIPIPVGSAVSARTAVERDSVHETTTVDLDVPAATQGRLMSAWVRTSDALQLSSVRGPDGERLPNEQVVATRSNGVLTVEVDWSQVAASGPGRYVFTYTSTTSLEPHVGMIPLVGLLFAAPAVLGVLAQREATTFQRQAYGEFVITARNLRWALWGVGLLYLLTLLWVVAWRMWPIIVAWPLQAEAAAVHIILSLCAIAFLVLGFLWRRQLDHLMRDELEHNRRTNLELQRSNEELERFAYVASHDLQEPLRTVANFTRLLQRRYHGKLDRDADEFIHYAVDGAERMQMLIRDMLAFSRVGTQPRDQVPVDLEDILGRVQAGLRAAVAESGALIEHDRLPVVRGDASQLSQLLQNLLGNAIKFRRPDAAPRIRLWAQRDGGHWRVAVSDNGIGIDPRHHQKVFEIFQRLHPRDKYPGTGIGLALCKKIVEQHGGRIWLESQAGQGATFLFTLPASAEGASA